MVLGIFDMASGVASHRSGCYKGSRSRHVRRLDAKNGVGVEWVYSTAGCNTWFVESEVSVPLPPLGSVRFPNQVGERINIQCQAVRGGWGRGEGGSTVISTCIHIAQPDIMLGGSLSAVQVYKQPSRLLVPRL